MPNAWQALAKNLKKLYGKDAYTTATVGCNQSSQIQEAIATAILAFGGVDLIVNNAGLSISKTIADHTEKDWDLLYDVLVKGQFLVTQAAVAVMKKQDIGGDIINIVSKNAW
jgi:NADP-dependent 3-hydroxy acid dehydrogenase YdfG